MSLYHIVRYENKSGKQFEVPTFAGTVDMFKRSATFRGLKYILSRDMEEQEVQDFIVKYQS